MSLFSFLVQASPLRSVLSVSNCLPDICLLKSHRHVTLDVFSLDLILTHHSKLGLPQVFVISLNSTTIYLKPETWMSFLTSPIHSHSVHQQVLSVLIIPSPSLPPPPCSKSPCCTLLTQYKVFLTGLAAFTIASFNPSLQFKTLKSVSSPT